MVLGKYHHVTHKRGKVCVRDRYVLRRLTDSMKVDVEVVKAFSMLASPHHFHADDLEKVFSKYLVRVETMVGNEIARHLLEDVLVRGVDRLESLRQVKRDHKQQIKTESIDAPQSTDTPQHTLAPDAPPQSTDTPQHTRAPAAPAAPAKRSRVVKRKKYRRKKKKW